jgi:hypothetical protein
MVLQDLVGLVSTPIPYAISVVCTMPVSLDELSGLALRQRDGAGLAA